MNKLFPFPIFQNEIVTSFFFQDILLVFHSVLLYQAYHDFRGHIQNYAKCLRRDDEALLSFVMI
jgi:uncharacterized membrane protein